MRPDDSSSCWRPQNPGYSAGNAGRRAPREIVRRVAAAAVAAVAGGGAVAVDDCLDAKSLFLMSQVYFYLIFFYIHRGMGKY